MPMSSKKWLHGGPELCPCQARSGYIEVKNYAHVKQEVVTWKSRIMPMSSKKLLHGGLATMPMTSKKLITWRSRTMPMTSKKWLHGSLELCPCQARNCYMEV